MAVRNGPGTGGLVIRVKEERENPWNLRNILPRDGNQCQVRQLTRKIPVVVSTVISVLTLHMSQ